MLSGFNLLTVAIDFGVKAFKAGVERAQEIQKASRMTGLTTKEVQELGFAAQMSGVSFAEFVQTITNGNKVLGRMALEGGGNVVALRRLGISLEGVRAGSVKSTDVLMKMADAYKKNAETAEMAALGAELFGDSFKSMIPMLRQGREGIEAYKNQAPTVTGVDVSAAADVKKSATGMWDYLTTTWVSRQFGHGNVDSAKIGLSDKTGDSASSVVDQLSKGADTHWSRLFGNFGPVGAIVGGAREGTGDYGIRGAGETLQDVRNKVAEQYGDEKGWNDKQKAIIAEFDKRIKAEGSMDLQKGIFQTASTLQQAGGGDILSAISRVDSLDAIKNATERSATALEEMNTKGGGSSSGTPPPAQQTDIVAK